MAVRVLIVDDDALVRAGLRMVLRGDPQLSVVAEASNGQEAVAAVGDIHPDVVLMDLQMPVMNGVEATRQVRRASDPPAVLILTTFHLDSYVIDALEAGAAGYVLKDTAPRELARAIHVVAAGESIFSAEITAGLVRTIAAGSERQQAASRRLADLTAREREVAEAVANGQPNATIAATLCMGEATVKTHVSRILAKTGAENRVQIALLVYECR